MTDGIGVLLCTSNSGITGGGVGMAGGQSAPRHFWPGNFCWSIGKREARKTGKLEKKRRKIEKGKGGKLKLEGAKVTKWGEDFFFFFFFFFCFSLFTFQSHWNLFWVYQNGKFLPGKGIWRREKIQEKWLCPPLKYYPLMPLTSTSNTCWDFCFKHKFLWDLLHLVM